MTYMVYQRFIQYSKKNYLKISQKHVFEIQNQPELRGSKLERGRQHARHRILGAGKRLTVPEHGRWLLHGAGGVHAGGRLARRRIQVPDGAWRRA